MAATSVGSQWVRLTISAVLHLSVFPIRLPNEDTSMRNLSFVGFGEHFSYIYFYIYTILNDICKATDKTTHDYIVKQKNKKFPYF